MAIRTGKRIYPDLQAWRIDEGLTQEQAAAILGVSQSYYCKLEQRKEFAGKRLGYRISSVTHVPLENVFGIL